MCAKHNITKDLVVSSVGNCCLWFATDYACDEKGKLVQFSVRFETEEQSNEFRKAIEQAQLTLGKAAQQWFCDSCNVKNKAEAAKCIACDTAYPEAIITVSSGRIGTPIASTTSNFVMLSSPLPQQEPSHALTTAQVSVFVILNLFLSASVAHPVFFF